MTFDTKDICKLNIRIMQFIWAYPKYDEEMKPKRNTTTNYILMVFLMQPISWGILADFYRQVVLGRCDRFTNITENILTQLCITTYIYFISCIYFNKEKFLNLNSLLENLDRFGQPPDQAQIERTQRIITCAVLGYCYMAVPVYVVLPYLYIDQCEEDKLNLEYGEDMTCGLFTRVWYPFRIDYFPVYQIVYTLLFYMSYVYVTLAITISTLQLGYVLHIKGYIRNLKDKLRMAFQSENVKQELATCIRYHMGIIDFCSDLNEAFRSSMFIHISVTSIVLSILALDFLTLDSLYECLRFILHMAGWVTILYIACWNGQQLINASADVAVEAYNTDWPNAELSEQTDILLIILRAQHPLLLKASSFGSLSYEMFMAIISTSYSYFTLLANTS